jgi:hypothetical protein
MEIEWKNFMQEATQRKIFMQDVTQIFKILNFELA